MGVVPSFSSLTAEPVGWVCPLTAHAIHCPPPATVTSPFSPFLSVLTSCLWREYPVATGGWPLAGGTARRGFPQPAGHPRGRDDPHSASVLPGTCRTDPARTVGVELLVNVGMKIVPKCVKNCVPRGVAGVADVIQPSLTEYLLDASRPLTPLLGALDILQYPCVMTTVQRRTRTCMELRAFDRGLSESRP